MSLSIEHILASDEWTTAEIESVRTAVQTDPALREAVRRWVQMSELVREGWDRDIPGRELLVLHALSQNGRSADLTDEETHQVLDTSAALESAADTHPGLNPILERIAEETHDFDRAWTGGSATIGLSAADRPATPGTTRMRLIRRSLALAATLVVLFISFRYLADPASQKEPANRVSLVTSSDEVRVIELEDGTSIRMLGASTLSYAPNQSRKVSFEGRAFFDVAHSDEPFEIESGHAVTTVLGTSFGLTSSVHLTEVTLVTGRVSFRANRETAEPVLLAPGQQSRLAGDGNPTLPTTVDLAHALDWTGLFIFRDTPLSSVATTLADTFKVEVRIADDLKPELLTGTFDRDQGVEEILRVAASALGAKFEVVEKGSIYLIRR